MSYISDREIRMLVCKIVEEFDKNNNSLFIKGNEEFSITRNELIEILHNCCVSYNVKN